MTNDLLAETLASAKEHDPKAYAAIRALLDLDAIEKRLSLANSVQLDEVVARHYREDVPALIARIRQLEAATEKVRAAEVVLAAEQSAKRIGVSIREAASPPPRSPNGRRSPNE